MSLLAADTPARGFGESIVVPGRITITNRHNLPQVFVDAVSHDDYTGGGTDYTTTGLLRPARLSELLRRHFSEITEDASERVWRLTGQAKHVILERVARRNPDRYLTEHRFFTSIAGKTLSGQVDLYDRETGVLYDWKEISVSELSYPAKHEWIAQGNINAWLCSEIGGLPVSRLENIAYARDWKKMQSALKENYPSCPIASFCLPLWEKEETRAYIEARIMAHEEARKILPECTDAERWKTQDKWAVVKKGLKRAVSLHDSLEQAIAHADDLLATVEHRPGEPRRCRYYCPVSSFCAQYTG